MNSTLPIRNLVSINELVSGLREFPASSFEETPEIQAFLREHPVDPATIDRFLCWNKQRYTRNLVAKTELFELVAICWEVGQQSSIHNHDEQNCWMAAASGRLLVQNYRTLFEDIQAGRCDIEPSDLLEMSFGNPVAVNPQEPVHKVFNPPQFGERAVSLHVYSRPFDHCVVYSEEQHTCGIIKLAYTTQFGKAVS
ncbi:MAG TPA: cysteine dioxygenase family protein [Terriglobales bacterium]|jgi:cysteine dioxygenase|nr:cysteine dioxygenase family protein [Terriglobales bacterium]